MRTATSIIRRPDDDDFYILILNSMIIYDVIIVGGIVITPDGNYSKSFVFKLPKELTPKDIEQCFKDCGRNLAAFYKYNEYKIYEREEK